MRKAISKKIRQKVYEKYNGHCAYCGCELEYKDMQVDHIVPVYDIETRVFNKNLSLDGSDDPIDNYMPSCRACNFYKGTFTLEKFRENISTILYRNLKKNFNYKLLLKYGLIKEDIHEVKFYFEQLKEQV